MKFERELKLMNGLADIHNEYLELEKNNPQHHSDLLDWVKAIHDLQRIIATRITRIEHPEIFK